MWIDKYSNTIGSNSLYMIIHLMLAVWKIAMEKGHAIAMVRVQHST